MKKSWVTALALASCTDAPKLDRLKPTPDYYYGSGIRGPPPQTVCNSQNASITLLPPKMYFPARIMQGRVKIAEIQMGSIGSEQQLTLQLGGKSTELHLTNGSYVLIEGVRDSGKKTHDVAALIACGIKGAVLLLNTNMNNLDIITDRTWENNESVRVETSFGLLEYGSSTNFFASDPQKICNGTAHGENVFFYDALATNEKIGIMHKRRRVAITLHKQERFITPKQRVTIEFQNKHMVVNTIINYGDYALIEINGVNVAAIISCNLNKVAVVPNSELKKGSVSVSVISRSVRKPHINLGTNVAKKSD